MVNVNHALIIQDYNQSIIVAKMFVMKGNTYIKMVKTKVNVLIVQDTLLWALINKDVNNQIVYHGKQ